MATEEADFGTGCGCWLAAVYLLWRWLEKLVGILPHCGGCDWATEATVRTRGGRFLSLLEPTSWCLKRVKKFRRGCGFCWIVYSVAASAESRRDANARRRCCLCRHFPTYSLCQIGNKHLSSSQVFHHEEVTHRPASTTFHAPEDNLFFAISVNGDDAGRI